MDIRLLENFTHGITLSLIINSVQITGSDVLKREVTLLYVGSASLLVSYFSHSNKVVHVSVNPKCSEILLAFSWKNSIVMEKN